MAATFLPQTGITFSDVLLVPQYSKVKTRSYVDLSVKIDCGTNKQFIFNHPIIPANMKTIIGEQMANEVVASAGLALLHRFCSVEEQLDLINKLDKNYVGVSIGVKEQDYQNVKRFVQSGVKIICIDVAHGDSEMCADMCKYISGNYPQILLIAGNVSTASGAKRLWESGADVVKVGQGNGSLCSTRIESAHGVPQFSALMSIRDCKQQYFGPDKYIIADGGMAAAGDLGKALCFSNMVMTGNLLAGSISCPGETVTKEGKLYKKYSGSSTHKSRNIEGVSSYIPVKAEFPVLLEKLTDGLRSCCSYQGVSNLDELKENPVFMKITRAAWIESKPHDLGEIE